MLKSLKSLKSKSKEEKATREKEKAISILENLSRLRVESKTGNADNSELLRTHHKIFIDLVAEKIRKNINLTMEDIMQTATIQEFINKIHSIPKLNADENVRELKQILLDLSGMKADVLTDARLSLGLNNKNNNRKSTKKNSTKNKTSSKTPSKRNISGATPVHFTGAAASAARNNSSRLAKLKKKESHDAIIGLDSSTPLHVQLEIIQKELMIVNENPEEIKLLTDIKNYLLFPSRSTLEPATLIARYLNLKKKENENENENENQRRQRNATLRHFNYIDNKRDIPLEIAEKLLNACMEYLLANPGLLETPGIFRESGNISTIQSLVVTRKVPDFSKLDIHIITGFMKQIISRLTPAFLDYKTVKDLDPSLVNDKLQNLDSKPLFDELIKFINKVAEHNESNQMSLKNLAIVFGPNIFDNYDLKETKNMIDYMFIILNTSSLRTHIKPTYHG